MRKLLSLLLVAAMLLSMVSVSVVPTAASTDPAESYQPKTAANEDSTLKLWFQHSNVKVQQTDTTSTGRNTYSVYMAKNERQGAQIVIHNTSSALKSGLKAELTEFTAMDESGATVDSQLFYEYYLNIQNVDTTNVLGVTKEEDSIIRNGITPDPIAPADIINYKGVNKPGTGTFGIAAGVTQSFYARAETTSETPSGWYKATFNLIEESTGNILKTADMFLYVWDFEIPEEVTYQTSMVIEKGAQSDETYKAWYDYLLENKIAGKCIPGEINSENEYITDPRVSAFSIADKGSYLGVYDGDTIASIYTDLSAMEEWDTVKEKAYFYLVDEPTSKEQGDVIGRDETVDKVINKFKFVSSVWENPYYVVPFHENHPYPYYTYDTELAYDGTKYLTADDGSGRFAGVKDAIQGMMDADAVTIWCPKMNAYTPRSVIASTGYVANNEHECKVRDLDGIVSGFNIFDNASRYFDWDSIFGSFEERINAYLAEKEEEGKDFKLWWYACGNNSNYTYANHLIENSGLQTQLMFWQSMQVGATGYLYYASNGYNENGTGNFTKGTDKAYDGTLNGNWQTNMGTKNGYNFYGNGVLFYGSDARSIARVGSQKYVGSIRVELMRDGIEDYEMLSLYRGFYGEKAMQDVISQVSNNVVDYLSMPSFNRGSKWASSMTDEDVFEQIRRNLGAAVEEATLAANSGYTLTIDGVEYGVFAEGETVTLPVPAMKIENGYANRFFTYTGAEVERGVYGSDKATANGRAYTLTMPAGDVALVSSFIKIGNIQVDSVINARDTVTLKRLLLGAEATSLEQAEAADIYLDGKLNSRDTLGLKKLMGNIATPEK